MKKSMYALLLIVLLSYPLFAQIGGIENSVNDISDTIRAIFPIILGIIFLVGFLFNTRAFLRRKCRFKKRYY